MSKNPINQKRGRRERRGVGAIIGGVILMAILLTTVLVYFITIQDNEKAKTSYEIKAAQASQDKQAEKYAVLRDTGLSGNNLSVSINNEGSMPMVVSKVLLYCISAGCTSPEPVEIPPSLTLNAGESTTRLAGPVSNTLTYRVDVISERGNIVSAIECTVDATAKVCKNDSNGSGSPDFSLSASPSALITETGKTVSSTITVTSLNGFSSAVALSISPTITGVPATFSPTSSVTPPSGGSATRTLTFAVSSSAAPGNYVMTITGTSAGMPVRTTQLSLSILSSSQTAVDTGIIQGTGSLKLDFKAFGAIYPDLGSRKGVDQRGWNVQTSSQSSSVTGYPGYDVMLGQNDPHVAFVESARNMDPSGQDLKLSRTAGLLTSSDQVQGTPPSSNFICKGDVANKRFLNYDETTNFTDLPNTPIGSAQTVNWQNIYFCTSVPSTGTGGQVTTLWMPPTKFSTLNGIFMVARGTFHPIFSEYAQTVPYQAVYYAKGGINACLRSSTNINNNTPCPLPNTADDVTASLQYSATKAAMKAGVSVSLHVTGANGPYYVSWLYPDGNYTQLANAQNLNANGNIQLNLPRKNTNDNDGNTVDDIDTLCNGIPAGQSRYFTLTVTDTFDATANRSVYHMTWGMVC